MGDKVSKEVDKNEADQYFNTQQAYTASKCVDSAKLQLELVFPERYCAYQMILDKQFEGDNLKGYRAPKHYKSLLREPFPDSKRRAIILQLFELNPFDILVKLQGDDFFQFTKKAQRALQATEYRFLNSNGAHYLEIILSMLFKEYGLKHCPYMATVASVLLLFLPPAEVYFTLTALLQRSQETLKNEELTSHIRWHFTFEKAQYFRLLSTFVRSYLNTTLRKQRSILVHLKKIDFDFNRIVDLCFKSVMSHFVALPVAIDIVMAYLNEGVKILFRFTYALLKVHKNFIKSLTTGDGLIEKLKAEIKANTDPQRLAKYAYRYSISNKHYNFKHEPVEHLLLPYTLFM